MKNLWTALAPLTLLAAGPAAAAVVYDNGPPNASSGNEATAWIQAEDFRFAATTVLTGANVYIGFLNGDATRWDGAFDWYIFNDAGGAPGSIANGGGSTPAVTDTGIPWCCGGNSQQFSFNFGSPFTAAAGATYWLGIHLSSNYDRDEIYWVTTAPNTTSFGYESLGGTLNNWSTNGQEHAFQLIGEANGAIPEPATWAMMIVGFGAIGWSLRARRRVKVSFATS